MQVIEARQQSIGQIGRDQKRARARKDIEAALAAAGHQSGVDGRSHRYCVEQSLGAHLLGLQRLTQHPPQRIVANPAGHIHLNSQTGKSDCRVRRAATNGQAGVFYEAIATRRRQVVDWPQHQVSADEAGTEDLEAHGGWDCTPCQSSRQRSCLQRSMIHPHPENERVRHESQTAAHLRSLGVGSRVPKGRRGRRGHPGRYR